ncbi:period circadian protein isoform X2 [Zootermopsis nevadensis]|uniref:period circadian protein isoform X2 n=1 Tax=Zootermopsis nevadensis TaxID=136037 RepID=UPI000B8EDDC0|nr:period circadian protein isoform X2 [Zootermopsis nevadensis]
MEETVTHNTTISDSAYSKSSNSQSQRSSGSSKSRHSISSGSSGYGGHTPSMQSSGNESFPQPLVTKCKEHKKKNLKSSSTAVVASAVSSVVSPLAEHENVVASHLSLAAAGATVPVPLAVAVETDIPGGGSERNSISSHAGVGLGAAGVVPATITGPSNETLQMALLTCVKKLQKPKDLPVEITEEIEAHHLSLPVEPEEKEEMIISSFEPESSAKNEGEFCVVVSMQDGMVVFTTPSITDVVGFPKDMWLGRSFIDFIHPKHRAAFTSHIASGVVTPLTHMHKKGASHPGKNSFYCCLRRYRGLRSSGSCVTEKEVSHLPFQLNMTFREFVAQNTPPDQEGNVDPEGLSGGCNNMFLVITAKLISSAYKYAGETCKSPKFVMCHLASCKLSYVDPESVPYLGYLPHDMLGKSVLEFYHPEDLPFLKEVYKILVKGHGSSFRSKPYRFRAQNGGYVLLETEWSTFVNPWSKKLEFLIGQHRVLKGPENADVFMSPNEEDTQQISEEVLKESKIIQEEIRSLLSETVRTAVQPENRHVTKRCRALATFMEGLMDDVYKPDLKVDLPEEHLSFSEHDSVMLGEISPHHDYCDSKSSTETPPSYNQLNYNDNIQRFFESKPKTTLSDESGDSKMEANRSLMGTEEEMKSGQAADSSPGSSNRKCCFPVNGSGTGSGSGHSSGSAGIGESTKSRRDTSATNTSQGSYKPPILTEALLYRHNEDMEKRMVQKHKEQRNKGSERENKQKKCVYERLLQEQCHGVKRSGSHSWEGELRKASKHPHVDVGKEFNPERGGGSVNHCLGIGKQHSSVRSVPRQYQGGTNVNLWPPFTVAPMQQTAPCSTRGMFTANTLPTRPQVANVVPVYYIPSIAQQAGLASAQIVPPQEHPGPPRMSPSGVMLPGQQPAFYPHQVPFMNAAATMFYQYPPVYGAPPVIYPPMTMLQPATALLQAPCPRPDIPAAVTCKQERKSSVVMADSGTMPSKFQRPASQATSVKAEPGSVLGSVASASVKRGMSESSKKEKSLYSVGGGQISPNISQDGEKIMRCEDDKRDTESIREAFSTTQDSDCSYSSFYSFLETDKSDASMNSSPEYASANPVNQAEEMVWKKLENVQPMNPRSTLKEPPWMEEVHETPDLVYRYQMKDQKLRNVLQADLQALENIHQPFLVNDQLNQLYLDMELEGLSTKLKIEEGSTSSSGSSGEDVQSSAPENECVFKGRKKQRNVEYGKLVMIFEENAPLPPPPCKE